MPPNLNKVNTPQQATSPSKKFRPHYISNLSPREHLSYPQTPYSPKPLAHEKTHFIFRSNSKVNTTYPTTPLAKNSLHENSDPKKHRGSGRQVVASKLFNDPIPWETSKEKDK